MGRVVKFTRPINYLGLPTLALPIPRGGGLPNGIQLIGRPFAEAQLFAIGQAYQREVPPEIARPLSVTGHALPRSSECSASSSYGSRA